MDLNKRYHDLDALRAFAMLLGIALHAFCSFFPLPIWPAQDAYKPEINMPEMYVQFFGNLGYEVASSFNPFWVGLTAIHGFRMQLFFLISGFFTAMLIRKRGLKKLFNHRFKRIFLPLIISLPIIWVSIIPAAIYGGVKKEQVRSILKNDKSLNNIFDAAQSGDLEQIKKIINEDAASINKQSLDGATPLITACMFGQSEAVSLLISVGAELDKKNIEGSTAMSVAVFFGYPEIVSNLIDAGADLNIKSKDGSTPLDIASAPWKDIKPFYDMVGSMMEGLEMDYDRIQSVRPQIVKLLRKEGAVFGATSKEEADLGILFYLIFFAPVFHHLWFLYYLLWLILALIFLVWINRKIRLSKIIPDFLITTPACLIVLLPLTLFVQRMMPDEFGPVTAPGILPWPPLLSYYGIFFIFGALCYGRERFESIFSRSWLFLLGLALPFLIFGLALQSGNGKGSLFFSVCAVTFVWLMVFGLIGLFRSVFSRESKFIRYVSDSSYWLYISHLPFMMFLQALVSTWQFSPYLKCLIVCVLTLIPLMLMYRYSVRYTFIGTLLNGKRKKLLT
ncbi:MAG: hypothetical protein CMP45_00935 [Rickettsiales bacterium]|nr:hypothetical protein [Rickettsiales bacterium]